MRVNREGVFMKNKNLIGGLIIFLLVLGMFGGCDSDTKEETPAVPTGISATVVSGGIKISWNPVKNATHYVISRQEVSSGDIDQLSSTVSSSEDSYIDTNGISGTSYSYAVAARNNAGTSDRSVWSSQRTFPSSAQTPAVPAGITAVAQSSSIITVSWSSVTGATGYKVYRDSNSGGNFTNLVSSSTPLTGTSFNDTGLQANTDYYYKVTSVNSAGESNKSVYATAKTGSPGVADVDFTSYTTDYGFRVRNNTSTRLVAFRNTLTIGNILGGVPANANEHGFKREIFGIQSADFPVIFITEDQYNANKNNLFALENTPFTRIYAYFNAVGTNEVVYDINASLGGQYTLRVVPSLQHNVELRMNGPQGATLGYVTAEQHDTYFKVNEGFYKIFPVIRKYNQFRNVITSHIPRWPEGVTAAGGARSISIGIGPQDPEGWISINNLLTDIELTTGSAFIIVDNRTLSSVRVYNGSSLLLEMRGTDYVNSGQEKIYQVNMAQLQDDKFAQSTNVSTYKIGSDLNVAGAIGNHDLEIDKIYRVIVTGSDAQFFVSAPEFEAMMEP